jgi:hypothetical protein
VWFERASISSAGLRRWRCKKFFARGSGGVPPFCPSSIQIVEEGHQAGIVQTRDALQRAKDAGLDLIEVAPTAVPPVCRIMDYGKFKYETSKHDKEKKSASSKLKEIKFRVNIDAHDYVTKIRHAEEFLDKGNKVRIQLPELAPGQFHGLYFENIESEYTRDIR